MNFFQSLATTFFYGFDYVMSSTVDNSSLLLQSPKMEFVLSNILKILGNKSYPLVYGRNVKNKYFSNNSFSNPNRFKFINLTFLNRIFLFRVKK